MELGKRKADKDKLIISEIPYTMIGAGINKFLVDVADLVESKKLTDVVDISNQSNKEGIRIVLELRKDADIDKIKISSIRKQSWRIHSVSICWPLRTAALRR